MVAYIGSFGAGLLNGYLQMRRLRLQQEWYDEMIKYYEFIMKQAGRSGEGGAFAGGTAGAGQLGPGGRIFGGGRFSKATTLAELKANIGQFESGGDYSIVNKKSGAIGKYQVMPNNVSSWTKEALGKEMTPEEFRNNPDAQEKVADYMMNKYYQANGSLQDVASMWFTGKPWQSGQFADADAMGTTPARYVSTVLGSSVRVSPGAAEATARDAPSTYTSPDVAPVTTEHAAMAAQRVDMGPNNVYGNLPSNEVGQFIHWNNDPIGNDKANLASVDPKLQKVIERVRADNPDLKFVIGNGKRTAEQQDYAKSIGWSKVGSKDAKGATHMQGRAADLWPIDENGKVTFDPAKHKEISDAMKKAADEEGVPINWGGDWKSFKDEPHFELKGAQSAEATGGPEGPQTSYQVAGGDVGLTEEEARRSAANLAAHRAAVTPEEQHTAITDPDVAKAWPDPVPPEETQTIRRAFADQGMSGYPDTGVSGIPASPRMPPRTPTPTLYGSQQGPESSYAPPDLNVYNTRPLSPSDAPSSGVAASVHDSRYGPPQRTGAPPNVGITPSSVVSTAGDRPDIRDLPPGWKPDLTARSLAKGKDADKGAKKAEPVKGKAPEAKKEAPEAKGIPEQPGLAPGTFRYEVPTSGASRAPIYTAADPFWRPNHPLNTVQAQRVQQEAPSATAKPPTATSQAQQNQNFFTRARQNIAKAITPDTGVPAAAPAAAAAPATGGAAAPATGGAAAQNLPPPPPPPNFAGDFAPPEQPITMADVPPPPTPTPINDPFQGGGGIPQQPGGQMVAQAQPVPAPYPRRQEDQGDESPAGALAARRGGPIYKFQAGGQTWTPYQPSTLQQVQQASAQSGQQLSNENAALGWMGGLSGMPYAGSALTGLQGNTAASNAAFAANWGAMTPAQQATYDQIVQTGQVPSTAAATPAAIPTTAPPATTNTINYNAIAPAVTQVNPASGSTGSTTNTATGSPMTWATGQTGTITAPNTSPGVASFGQSGVAGTANYYNPYTNTQSGGGTTYGLSAQDTATNQAGYAKGGVIQKFQGAGAVSPNPVVAAMYAGTYTGPTSGGGWTGTPYAQLAPNQQAWADQQRNVWAQINQGGAQDAAYWGAGGTSMTGPVDTSQYLGQLSLMPAAQQTAPYTGPPQTTNSIVNTSIAPAVTQVNPASGSTGTTSNTATGSPLTWTSGQTGTITAPNTTAGPATFGEAGVAGTSNYYNPYQQSGGTTYGVDASGNLSTYQGGGAVDNSFSSSLPSQQVGFGIPPAMGYQDGGDVSPASLGAPPGMPMGGQGQQPIPPIYFNQATFSPYGAGVGKGVSYPSATTLVGSAVPTYAKGGVVAYQDGGDVGSESIQDPGMDQAGYTVQDAAYRTGIGGGGVLPGMSMGRMGGGMSMRGPGMGRRPSLSAVSRMGSMEGYADPQGNPLYTPEGYPIDQQQGQRPDSAPGDMAQINDGYGNLAYGATSAIASVFHFIGNALGLDPQSQQQGMPNNPMVQTNRRDFANKVAMQGAAGPAEDVINSVDGGTNTLNRELKVIGGLESVYKWHMMNGDPEGAVRSATTMLMYLNHVASEYGARAVDDMQGGNIPGAVDNIVKAYQQLPNGKQLQAHVNPDTGNTVYYRQTDLNGKIVAQGELNAPTLLNIALKTKNGSAFYNELEQVAYSHDPETRRIADEKRKEAESERQAGLANAAIRQMEGIPQGPGQGPAQGQQPQPKIIPVSGQGGGAPPVQPAAATGAPLTAGSLPPASQQPPPGAARPGATTGIPTPGPGAPPSGSAEGQAQPVTPPREAGPETAGSPVDYSQPEPQGVGDISLVSQPQDVQFDPVAVKAQVDAQYKRDGKLIYDRIPEPDTSGMAETTANKVLNYWASQNKEREAEAQRSYNAALSEANLAERQRVAQANIRQGEMFQTKLRGAEAQQHDIWQAHREEIQKQQQARAQAHQEFMDNVKRSATISDKAQEPRTDAEFNSVLRINPDTGTSGISDPFKSVPEEYLAKSNAMAVGPDGKKLSDQAAQQQYVNNYTEAERGAMDQTWQSAVRWNRNVSPAMLADVIAGVANGTYTATPPQFSVVPFKDNMGRVSPDDPFMAGTGSTQRIAMTIIRPGSRTAQTIILPDQDARNLMRTSDQFTERTSISQAKGMRPGPEAMPSTVGEHLDKGIPWGGIFSLPERETPKPGAPTGADVLGQGLRGVTPPGTPDWKTMTPEQQRQYYGIPMR